MRMSVVFILAVWLCCGNAFCDTRTTRGKLKAVKEKTESIAWNADTASVLSSDSIMVAGYDKALRSNKESFRVINRYVKAVVSLEVDIVYRDAKSGNMLHARKVFLNCNIPSGETRQLEWSAWDRQNRYYYRDTRVIPRSPKAVAYEVSIYPRNVRFSGD